MKYIILDFGNVLFGPTSGKWFLTPKFYEEIDINKIDMNKVILNNSKASPYLSDKMITLDDEIKSFNNYYKTLLNGTGFEEKASVLANDFVFESSKYTMFPLVKQELETLSQKYKLILLSDNWPCGERILKEYGLYDFFDKVYLSSVYQEVKRDGKFFDIMIDDLNLKVDEAVFIDDNEEILDVANKKGLKCFRMDRISIIKDSKYKIINNLFDVLHI